jgi:hypothetical protein
MPTLPPTPSRENVTYVSFLLRSHTDPVEPMQRIEWLKPLWTLNINLILIVDKFFMGLLSANSFPKGVRLLLAEKDEFDTYKRIQEASRLRLPTHRNQAKDTLEYMAIQNLKPELLVKALQLGIYTPYMAYIDAGISKIFRNPDTIRRLETFQFHNIPMVLMPGCHPMPEDPPSIHILSDRINWTFCGGFFVVPSTKVKILYEKHRAALEKFLEQGCLAWEVNVWTSYLPHWETKSQVVWYPADHNDSMLTAVPSSQVVSNLAPNPRLAPTAENCC